jgi:hypothetical protein
LTPSSSPFYTKDAGAWIKNPADEARMVDAMRKGAELIVMGTSGRGITSADQYSLKGLAQALDKVEEASSLTAKKWGRLASSMKLRT